MTSLGFFVGRLGHVITLRGNPTLRVYVQNVPVCTGTTTTCGYTCGRVAGTHGGRFGCTPKDFWACHSTHHTRPDQTTPHHTTPHTHTTTTTTTTATHSDNDNGNDNDTQRHTTNQPAASFDSTRKNSPGSQTQQGLTDCSLLML